MDAMTALRTRRTFRKYKKAPIRKEDMQAILDAGRLAPSGVNRQSWRFVVIDREDLLKRVAGIMEYGKHVDQAGAAIIVLTGPDAVCPCEDAPAATTSMLLAAHALGYAGCWIGAHDNPSYPELHALIGAPSDWRVMALFCIGVPDGPAPEPPKKPLEEVVSYNGF